MGTQPRIERTDEQYCVDGQKLWRVTHVIRSISRSFIPDDEAARERGIAVHQACRFFDEDGPDFEKNLTEMLDDQIRPYLHAWVTFRKEMDFTPQVIEQPIIMRELGYAGTPDRYGKLGVTRAVVDIKTGLATKDTPLQTIAYAGGISGSPSARVAVELRANGRYNLIEYPVADWHADWACWISMLNIFKWQKRREEKRR